MAITVRKTIPTTSTFNGYTTGGDTTIELIGVDSFIGHSKKTLLKVGLPKSPQKAATTPVDYFDYNVIDLSKGTDEIVMKGYVEDDATTTAWEKVWKLRAMCVSPGPLTSLVLENITFSSSTIQAFLEDISWTHKPDDTTDITTSAGDGVARIEVTLNFFIGNSRS